MNKTIIFHHNDMDGYGSLYIVNKFVNSNKPTSYLSSYDFDSFIRVNYETNVGDKFALASNDNVYIVDYSFTDATKYQLDGLLSRGCKVTWIDHHISSINLQNKYPELQSIPGIRNNSMSGAALCYLYFSKGMNISFHGHNSISAVDLTNCPKFIQYISDYDTFAHTLGETTDYFKLVYDVYRDKMNLLYNLDHNDYVCEELISKGSVIKQYIDSENAYYCKAYSYESEMYDGTKCLVVNKRSNSWIFGDKINEYPICVVAVFNGEEWQYSLFSTDNYPDIDCSKYAEHYGGGGHLKVSGFRSKELLFKKI